MDNLKAITNYGEFKEQMDTVLKTTVENFVKTGYLLKVARDTNILEESGYKSVTEFAQAEYGLNATQVSRFIHINDRFSEGGYSDMLQEKYQGFGYAKLTIMLQIPDYIAEELTPEYTKAEVQAVKDEYTEEMKVTDIERMTEEPETFEERLAAVTDERLKLLCTVILQLGHDDPRLYTEIAFAKAETEAVKDLMAPNEEKIFNVRVKGMGRMMLAISENSIHLVNTRTGEKKTYFWNDIVSAWIVAGVLEGTDGKEAYRMAYGEDPVIEEEQKPTRVQKAEPQKEEKKEPKQEPKKEAPKKENPKKEEKEEMDEETGNTGELSDTAGYTEEPAENREERTQPEDPGRDDSDEGETDTEPDIPEPVEELTGEIVEEETPQEVKVMTRKEYMDTLTEFGMAQYMHHEYIAGRLTGGMFAYHIRIERWLSEKVDERGIGLEDVIDEPIEGQISMEEYMNEE